MKTKSAAVLSFAVTISLLAPTLTFAQASEVAVRTYFKDLPVMVSIADCESQFHQYNDDGSVLHGGYKDHMIGIFQFAPFHKKTAQLMGYDIDSLAGNMAYARYLYNQSGTVPWADSEWCWSGSRSSPKVYAGTVASAATSDSTLSGSDKSAQITELQFQVNRLSAVLNALIAAKANS